jgi:hypothetical protein
MKNIHVLPTDKPSRLFIHNAFNDLRFDVRELKHDNNQNIYITSDEEIEWDSYWLNRDNNVVSNGAMFELADKAPSCKKIILTTDELLDGVQAIDDEFLEWFVKNPSCKKVEVEEFEPIYGHQNNSSSVLYKIIIPKEEPNLETIAEIGRFAERKYLDRLNNFERCDFNDGVFEGAKWQSERMYSEEEVYQLLYDLSGQVLNNKVSNPKLLEKWFEQFKKK